VKLLDGPYSSFTADRSVLLLCQLGYPVYPDGNKELKNNIMSERAQTERKSIHGMFRSMDKAREVQKLVSRFRIMHRTSHPRRASYLLN
jgi:hypothetical protein